MLNSILQSDEFIMTVKFLLALLCGGILGLEREQKRRPAGFRTYMLVCVGSTLVMVTNQYLCELYPGIDPSRMGAQVISGIGFLGVGTIIVTGDNRVKGLTTAAGLWATACVGLAIGAGNYYAAIMVSTLIYFAMSFLQSLDKRVISRSRVIDLYMEFEEVKNVGNFIRELRKMNIKVNNMEFKTSLKNVDVCVTVLVTLSLPGSEIHQEVMERFHNMEGVIYAEEI